MMEQNRNVNHTGTTPVSEQPAAVTGLLHLGELVPVPGLQEK